MMIINENQYRFIYLINNTHYTTYISIGKFIQKHLSLQQHFYPNVFLVKFLMQDIMFDIEANDHVVELGICKLSFLSA